MLVKLATGVCKNIIFFFFPPSFSRKVFFFPWNGWSVALSSYIQFIAVVKIYGPNTRKLSLRNAFRIDFVLYGMVFILCVLRQTH